MTTRRIPRGLVLRAIDRMAAELLSYLHAEEARERARAIGEALATDGGRAVDVARELLRPSLMGRSMSDRVLAVSRTAAAWARETSPPPTTEAEQVAAGVITCPWCDGDGDFESFACALCHGRCVVDEGWDADDGADEPPRAECGACQGSGGGPDVALRCPTCGGSGRSVESRRAEAEERAAYRAECMADDLPW